MRITLLLFFILSANLLLAQTTDIIHSDRPGFTLDAFTVGSGIVQFQLGGSYTYSEIEDNNLAADDYLSQAQLRIGLNEQIEIFGALAFSENRTVIGDAATEIGGVSDLDAGIRINLFDNEGWVPSVGMIAQLKMNKYEGDLGISHFAPKLAIATHKEAADFASIRTNLGIEWNGINLDPKSFYTINISLSAGEILGFYIENYGFYRNDDFDAGFNGGLSLLLGSNLKIDAGAGFSRNEGEDRIGGNAGLSYRVGKSLRRTR